MIDLTVSVLKTVYNVSNCLKMCLNIAIKLVMCANYHDHTIIASYDYC